MERIKSIRIIIMVAFLLLLQFSTASICFSQAVTDPDISQFLTFVTLSQANLKTLQATIDDSLTYNTTTTAKTWNYSYTLDLANMRVREDFQISSSVSKSLLLDDTGVSTRFMDNAWKSQASTETDKENFKDIVSEEFNHYSDIQNDFTIQRNPSADATVANTKAFDLIPESSTLLFSKKTIWVDMTTGLTMASIAYDADSKVTVKRMIVAHAKVNGLDLPTDVKTENLVKGFTQETKMSNITINNDVSAKFQK